MPQVKAKDYPARVGSAAYQMVMDEDAADQLAAVFDAVSHPLRLQILELLAEGEAPPAIQEAVGSSLQNVHKHIERLVDANLVYRPAEEGRTFRVTPLGRFVVTEFLEADGTVLLEVMEQLEAAREDAEQAVADLPLAEDEKERVVTERMWEQVEDELYELLAE